MSRLQSLHFDQITRELVVVMQMDDSTTSTHAVLLSEGVTHDLLALQLQLLAGLLIRDHKDHPALCLRILTGHGPHAGFSCPRCGQGVCQTLNFPV